MLKRFLLCLNPIFTSFPLSFAKVMEFYCPHCETAMCQECTNGEHGEHPTVPLKDVVEQHKASLQEQLGAVKQRYASRSTQTSQRRALII